MLVAYQPLCFERFHYTRSPEDFPAEHHDKIGFSERAGLPNDPKDLLRELIGFGFVHGRFAALAFASLRSNIFLVCRNSRPGVYGSIVI